MVLRDEDVRAALIEVIGAGVVPAGEIEAALRERGHRIGRDRIDRHLQFDTSFADIEDGWIHRPTLMDGIAFAAPVDPGDAAEGFLRMQPWFDAIGWWLIEDHPDLLDPSGSILGALRTDGWWIDEVDTDVLLGPDGWLDRVAGGWMALRVSAGSVVLEPLEAQPLVDEARAGAVRRAFDRVAERLKHQRLDTGEVVEVRKASHESLLLEAIAADPVSFRGVPVAGPEVLFAAAGLQLDDHWVVADDIDPEVLSRVRAQQLALHRYGVDADTGLGIEIVLGAMSMHAAGEPDAFGSTEDEREASPLLFAGLLGNSGVAQAVALECRLPDIRTEALAFAEEVAEAVVDIEPAWGASWLVAHCHLVAGEVDRAAGILDRMPASAESLPLVIDRALVEIERSNASNAGRLLDRAAALVESLVEPSLARSNVERTIGTLSDEIEPWASVRPPAMARRNDPCPCGSGRKYKVCHQGRELHPLEERSAWLNAKMDRFARTQADVELRELAAEAADHMGRPDLARSLLDSPFLPDLVLHEQGLAERFLEGRSATLPGDEVLLAQQWQLVDRSVFEIEAVSGGDLRLRDLATGDIVNVLNTAGPASPVGSLMLGRPLPVGEVHRAFSGFVAAPPDRLGETLAMVERGDAGEIVAFLGRMNRAPVLTNTDGHDLVPMVLTWALPGGAGPDEVADSLRACGLSDDGEGVWCLERDTPGQRMAVIATVSLEGSILEGHVNSIERAEELSDLIDQGFPGADHLDTRVVDLDGLGLDAPTRSGPTGALDPSTDPAVLATMRDYIADYEQEWLDLSVPALGGRTPREAAADPTTREDVVRLIATFPEPTGDPTLAMSPSRLRAALGLSD